MKISKKRTKEKMFRLGRNPEKKSKENGFIHAILMSGGWQKNLNLLIKFSNSVFIKLYYKGYWQTCIQNKLAY